MSAWAEWIEDCGRICEYWYRGPKAIEHDASAPQQFYYTLSIMDTPKPSCRSIEVDLTAPIPRQATRSVHARLHASPRLASSQHFHQGRDIGASSADKELISRGRTVQMSSHSVYTV